MINEIGGLIKNPNNFRFEWLPKSAVRTAKTSLETTGNIERVSQYLISLFEIYRECVCYPQYASHIKVDGTLEWPSPAEFSWKTIDKVIEKGKLAKSNDGESFYRNFKYALPENPQIIFLPRADWQEASFGMYVRPTLNILKQLRQEELTPYDAQGELENLLHGLQTSCVIW